MKRNTLYIAIIGTVFITFGLTRLWDRLNQDKDIRESDEIFEEQGDHNDQEENQTVQLSPRELEEFDIVIGTVGPGELEMHRDLPGENPLKTTRLSKTFDRPRVQRTGSEIPRKTRKTLQSYCA